MERGCPRVAAMLRCDESVEDRASQRAIARRPIYPHVSHVVPPLVHFRKTCKRVVHIGRAHHHLSHLPHAPSPRREREQKLLLSGLEPTTSRDDA